MSMVTELGTAHRWITRAINLGVLTVHDRPPRWSGHATRYTINDPDLWQVKGGTDSPTRSIAALPADPRSKPKTVPPFTKPPMTCCYDDDGRDVMGHTGLGRSAAAVYAAAARHFPDGVFTDTDIVGVCPRHIQTVRTALRALARVREVVRVAAGWVLAPQDGEGYEPLARLVGVFGRSRRRVERHAAQRAAFEPLRLSHLA